MYGVLWSGKAFYEGALETLKYLKDNKKIVCILSNSTTLSDGLKKRVEEEYRDFAITSGEVMNYILKNSKLEFKVQKDYKKVYVFGKKGVPLFDGTDYEIVENLDDADFVYISVPQLTEEEYNNYSGDKSIFRKSKNGNWDSIKIDPFLPQLDKYLEKKLPLLNANPDLTAAEADANTGEISFVTRQGCVAETYRNMGGEVLEFGKPNKNIYDYAFDDIEKTLNIKIDKSKVVMIGDTLRTDIKGANNVGIDSILFTKTGVTANELENGENLETLYKKYDAKPTYLVDSVKEMKDM